MASEAPKMKATLGLTGLTVNAMALIAPGAFLWLTYTEQAAYGAPMAGSDIWFGIFAALLLCFATAVSYAELSKLYPGAGSSYFFAEQAYLGKTHIRQVRPHRQVHHRLGQPPLLLGLSRADGRRDGPDRRLHGRRLHAQYVSARRVASPLLMIIFCVVFAIGVGYIAYRGANTSTGVNLAVNIVQISALLVFAVIAIGYRATHADGIDPLDARPLRHRDQVRPRHLRRGRRRHDRFEHAKDFEGGRTARSLSTSWRTTAATPRRTTRATTSSRRTTRAT